MILRLSGADFSANNIGTIQLVRELREDTKTLIANYTRGLTESQKFAVQDFIDNLKSEDIWSHIGNLYLPVLGGALSETLYNVKTGTVDAVPTSDGYVLENDGIRAIGTDKNYSASVKYNGSQMNLHMLVYNTTLPSETEMTNNDFVCAGAKSEDGINRLIQFDLNKRGVPFIKTDTGMILYNHSIPKDISKSLKGYTQRTDGVKVLNAGILTNAKDKILETDNTYTDFSVGILSFHDRFMQEGYCSYGLFSMGSALSDEQMLKYHQLANTLMTAMGVSN